MTNFRQSLLAGTDVARFCSVSRLEFSSWVLCEDPLADYSYQNL